MEKIGDSKVEYKISGYEPRRYVILYNYAGKGWTIFTTGEPSEVWVTRFFWLAQWKLNRLKKLEARRLAHIYAIRKVVK